MQRDRTSKYSRSVRGFLPGRQRLRSSFANEHSQGARWLILSSGHGSLSPPNARLSGRPRRAAVPPPSGATACSARAERMRPSTEVLHSNGGPRRIYRTATGSLPAQASRRPVLNPARTRLRRIVQNESEGASDLLSSCLDNHRQIPTHRHPLAGSSPERAVWRFEALFSAQDEPRLRSRVLVYKAGLAGAKGGRQVHRGVSRRHPPER